MKNQAQRRHRHRHSLLVLVTAAMMLPALPAEARRGTRGEAISICSEEMSRRFGNAPVQVERVDRVTRRGDRLSVEARMRARRMGSDVRRDVDCAVDFSGRRGRIVSFSSSRNPTTGGGWGHPEGGDDQRASRICWREAQSVGYRVSRVLSVRPAERGGRIVVLRAGKNDEVHCLYRNGVRDLRYRRR
jgi:hypothetical protein